MALLYVALMVFHCQTARLRFGDMPAVLQHSPETSPPRSRFSSSLKKLKQRWADAKRTISGDQDQELLQQIRTEIEYLIHSDFHINAWTGGIYPIVPDDVLMPFHAHHDDSPDSSPEVTVQTGGVSVTYPVTSKVMLKNRTGINKDYILGTMSGEVVCQVVGPDAARYTTCNSDAALHINRADNAGLGGFQFKPEQFDACLTSSMAEVSKCPHNLQARQIGVRQSRENSDLYLAVLVPLPVHHMTYKYKLGPAASDQWKLAGVGMSSDGRCLVLHTRELGMNMAVVNKQIVLCPPIPVSMQEDGVEQWLNEFPAGRELLWQLCAVGPASLFQSVLVPVQHNLCSHMGLSRTERHVIKWANNTVLKHPFYDANLRTVGVVLDGKKVMKMPCSQRSESAEITNCTKDQGELDELIDESLQVLDLTSISSDRRSQIMEDTEIVRTEGLDRLKQKPFFDHL